MEWIGLAKVAEECWVKPKKNEKLKDYRFNVKWW